MTSSMTEAAVKRLEKSLVYSTEATTEQIREDIDRLRTFDVEHEQLQRKGKLLIAGGVAGIAGGVAAGLLGSGSVAIVVLGVLLGATGAVLAIAGIWLTLRHGRLNLENRRYEVLSGLMRLLAADIAPDEIVGVKVDFRPHTARGKLVQKGKVSYWNVDYYVSSWFELRGRFVDGTKFSLAVIEKCQQRHGTKRSASGKLKHKRKSKSASEAVLKMRIKDKRYQRLQEAAKNIHSAVKLPPYARVKSVGATQDALSLTVSIGHSPWDVGSNEKKQARARVDLAAAMFMSLYEVLHSAKTIEQA
jgi:hypothetical protein